MKGKFRPNNPQKYLGNPTNIIIRSKWEYDFFKFCDMNDEIVQWGSEEIVIPYMSPLDKRRHRYFPDVVIKKKNGETILVEIKPYDQTQPPKGPPSKKKSFIHEVTTYVVNQAKWAAAEVFCRNRGWRFQLITEKELYRK